MAKFKVNGKFFPAINTVNYFTGLPLGVYIVSALMQLVDCINLISNLLIRNINEVKYIVARALLQILLLGKQNLNQKSFNTFCKLPHTSNVNKSTKLTLNSCYLFCHKMSR